MVSDKVEEVLNDFFNKKIDLKESGIRQLNKIELLKIIQRLNEKIIEKKDLVG